MGRSDILLARKLEIEIFLKTLGIFLHLASLLLTPTLSEPQKEMTHFYPDR